MNAIMPASISAAEYHAMQAAKMTEKQLQTVIVAAAKRLGWLSYHTFDSRRSEPGYPDLHLLHPVTNVSLFRELKTQKGKPSPDQITWLNALNAAGHDAAIWRPADWFNDTIARQLTGPWR